MTVKEQPVTIGDATIDAEYYAEQNPDVAAVFGTDAEILFQHYIMTGQAEGRLPYDTLGETKGDVSEEEQV